MFSLFGEPFPVFTGWYHFLFLYLEPCPVFTNWLTPSMGAKWFYHDMIPSNDPVPAQASDRTNMIVWQLTNTYASMFAIMFLSYFTVRNLSKNNLAVQERFISAYLLILSAGDVGHCTSSLLALPEHVRFHFSTWNGMAHGNISFVAFLLVNRIAWLMGVGRDSFLTHKTKSN
ncbi:hypothetical protein AX16_000618 [Volvariella volvacea WC 439]|nr:hypothetical protein AX16_000618 [Volvariella volvacea WC 439]